MKLKIKTPPDKPLITVNQVKDHLCLPSGFVDQDSLIQDYIDTAESMIDGHSGVLNRALITQSWTMVMDDFPHFISIPLPPGQTVDQIRFIDQSGVQQILDASTYVVTYEDQEFQNMIVEEAEGSTWPSVDDRLAAVEVDFTAGYGLTQNDVPPKMLQLMRYLTSGMFESRDTKFIGIATMPNSDFSTMVNNAKYWI